MKGTPEMISSESDQERSAFDIALQLRQETGVYVSIEVQVMNDYFDEHQGEGHDEAEKKWTATYSPGFENAFIHVVSDLVVRSNNSAEYGDVKKLGQSCISKKADIAHMIEAELYREAA